MEITVPQRALRFPGADNIGREPGEAKSKREILPYSDNATASYIPNVFLGSGNLAISDKERSVSVEILSALFLKSYSQTKNPAALLNRAIKIEDDIKNHVESRLQIFLGQLIVVFKTECTFEMFSTQSQAGVKVKKEKQQKDPSELVEAHASTLPSMQYISNTQMQNGDLLISQIKPRLLALHTSFYNSWNMTHKLPRFVNDVDSLIDKNISVPFFGNFRNFCLKILNDMARTRNVGIRHAFSNFLNNLEQIIDKALSQSTLIYQTTVLNWYKAVVHSYVEGVDQSVFWQRLGGTPDLEKDNIPLQIQNRISTELNCLDRIARIKKRCGSAQNIDSMVKTIVVKTALTDKRSSLIEEAIQKSNTAISSTNLSYVQQCCLDPDIRQTVIDYLNNFADDTEFQKQISNPTKLPFAQTIKDFLKKPSKGSPNGKKTIQNLDYICLKVLQEIHSAKDSPLKQKICKFFHVSPSMLEASTQDKTAFNITVDNLIKDLEVNQLCQEVHEDIIELE